MKALSIRQPWVEAILRHGKDVENRDWKNPYAPSGLILLHAAKGCTPQEYDEAGCAITLVSGKVPPPLSRLHRGGIVGCCRITRAVREEQPRSPWAVPGLVHLHLADVRELPFTPLLGQLGFFDVPQSIVDQLFPKPEQGSLFGDRKDG